VRGFSEVIFKYEVCLKWLNLIFYIMHVIYFQVNLMFEAFIALMTDVSVCYAQGRMILSNAIKCLNYLVWDFDKVIVCFRY
jgi:hypothetical protein